MKQLTRRVFLRDLTRIGGSMTGLGLLAGCAPPPAAAPGRVYRVGVLSGPSPLGQSDQVQRPFFWQRLEELGYVEGQNLAREIRLAEGEDNAKYDDFAAELVRLQVDVIVAGNGPGIRAAVAATSSIPIVMLAASQNPVALGWAESLARPGRNLTGTMGAPPEVQQKLLQLLVEAAHGVSKVAILEGGSAMTDDFWESAARSLRVDLLMLRPTSRDELGAAFERIVAEGADALLVQTGTVTNLNADFIVSFAERRRLPAVYPVRPWVTRGGLMTYQAAGPDIERRTADYVDRILRGARPADLPIENPTRYELVVNMKTARAIGLTFPASFRVQVDEVIE